MRWTLTKKPHFWLADSSFLSGNQFGWFSRKKKKKRNEGSHITPGTNLFGTELSGELWWPNLLGRRRFPGVPQELELPRGCSRRIPQAVAPTWKCAGSPQKELLSGQQVLKLLLLVLSSKSSGGFGKGGDSRTAEENLDTGQRCDFSFSVEQLFAAGNFTDSLYLFT